jgi:Protein of unknown function (DUF3551)
MRTLSLAMIIIAAAASTDTAMAEFRFGGAKSGAWCLWTDPYTYDCGFATQRQCLDTASGAGGNCAPNPSGPPAPPPQRTKRQKSRDD